MQKAIIVAVIGSLWAGSPVPALEPAATLTPHSETRTLPATPHTATPPAPVEVVTATGRLVLQEDDSSEGPRLFLEARDGQKYQMALDEDSRALAEKYEGQVVQITGLATTENGVLWLKVSECRPVGGE